MNGSATTLYGDDSFAEAGFTLANGNNTFTAIAQDQYGRSDTNTITCYLPVTNSYTYDLNGNLTSDGNRYFGYDDENQLVSVWVTNAWRSDLVYDGKFRRRIRREYTWSGSAWVQTNEVHYVYDRNLVIEERDANNLPTLPHTRGRDLSGSMRGAGGIGGLLSRTDYRLLTPRDPSASAYYHADGNGNITFLINTNQAVVAKYLYDPYGTILSQSGPLVDANLYRFSSKEFHANSGLVYYLYRFYDPNLQRWLSKDPIGEGEDINLYTFVFNDATDEADALGLDAGKKPPQHGTPPKHPRHHKLPEPPVVPSGPGITGTNGGGWWCEIGIPISPHSPVSIGAGVGGAGSLMMSHCPDNNCKKADCESCCKKGFGLALGGDVIGTGVGCIGTGGIGCGISIGIGLWNGYLAYDSYKSCMKGCSSKKN